MESKNEGYVFGLDIGTRSIVGTVGYRIGTDRFVVVAQESVEHETRAVIDGQIHDIPTVGRTIRMVKERLENRIQQPLTDVCIAAAGRVLKTKQVKAKYEFSTDTKITKEHIRSLDMMGVEMAYEEIRKDEDSKDKNFFCVGYSTVKYFLNGYPMEMIEMHMASYIEVELIATFLPEEVVDGLYSAVESADLRVANLTLEPIAAINIAIPEKFRLLNIALVDVGAGTSDISIVKDGSIIAFGMIPLAGDEVTECIARNYLTDFATAEQVKRQCERRKSVSFKDIFDNKVTVTREDIARISESSVKEITKSIAERIIQLNGDKSVSAVFVVGGGGKHDGFTESLAEYLNLPQERVAIRGAEVLGQVEFEMSGVRKDSTLVTPLGICMNYYEQRNNFIHVMVNEQRVKLYDNGKVTVLDACISSGFSKNNLFPIRGDNLTYTVNGQERVVKGTVGEVAIVKQNGKEVSLNEHVEENDNIEIRPATRGEPGCISLDKIPECQEEIMVTLFGKEIAFPKLVEVNGKAQEPFYSVQESDRIETFDYCSVAQILEYADIDNDIEILLNGGEAGKTAKVHSGDVISCKPKPIQEEEAEPEKDFQKQIEEDPLLQPMKPLPDWMKGIPFDTAKMGSQGERIPGAVEIQEEKKKAEPIFVTVNGDVVQLPDKPNPIFVDVFDVYPFDMTKAGGTRLVTRINGEDKDFTQALQDGDRIDLFWES